MTLYRKWFQFEILSYDKQNEFLSSRNVDLNTFDMINSQILLLLRHEKNLPKIHAICQDTCNNKGS